MIWLGHFNYWVVIFLMMVGFYGVIARGNIIKTLMGLTIFQTSVFILFISMGKVAGGATPIIRKGVEGVVYSNPLPHVLILTAIVVGVATMAVGLALTVRIQEAFGSIEEDSIGDGEEEAEAPTA